MAGGASAPPSAPVSRKPADSPFYQQRLKAWQPILTPKWVVITFLLIGIPFVGIGFWLKDESDKVVEYRVQYDGPGTNAAYSACQVQTGGTTSSCALSITTDKDMKDRVFVYYELSNFYQNHRRYVKSRSEDQLTGKVISDEKQLIDCDPLRTRVVNGETKVLQPCGLIAQSYFNDTFALASSGLSMDESGISWKADRDRFKGVPNSERAQYPNIQWITDTYPNVQDVTDEHFIVWMRPAALPRFRKLYGRIESSIPAGTTLTFNVASAFPVSPFEGTKALVVSTNSVIGGKNPFLGIAYIVVGFVCIGLALLFGLRAYFGGRQIGDTTYLVWPKK